MSLKRSIFIFLMAVLSFVAEAQPFAVLPDTPDLKKGVLPNGISYYIFQNTSLKGIADFALVQKTGLSDEGPGETGRVKEYAKDLLSWSERLGLDSPQQMMVRRGAIPREYGYVKVDSTSTVFWFDDVPVLDDPSVIDSTLLVLFDIIDRTNRDDDPFVAAHYSPAKQAVMISGDVDAVSLEQKMKMLSLMVMPRQESLIRKTESAGPDSTVASAGMAITVPEQKKVEASPAPIGKRQVLDRELGDHPVVLEIAYRLPRTPLEYMPTVYPAITSKYVYKLGVVAERRIRKLLEAAAVPCLDVDIHYISSCNQPGPERFIIGLKTKEKDVLKAAGAVATTLASMSTGNITMDEQNYAAGVFSEGLLNWAINPFVRNSTNIDRAISSYLYGTALTSARSEMNYLLNKSIAPELEQHLVNNFAKAILASSDALTLSSDSELLTSVQLQEAFEEGLRYASVVDPKVWKLHELHPAPVPERPEKIKLRQARPEPVTGGQMWIFSNGIKVVYKQLPIGDHLYAEMLVNRGYASLEGLTAGEGALMTDILKLQDINGLSYQDYSDALAAKGADLLCEVTNTSTEIGLSLPADSLKLAVDVLRQITTERSRNAASEKRYAEEETLRMLDLKATKQNRIQLIDSIMSPDSPISPYRKDGKFTPDLLDRAEKFFDQTFSNLTDGVLVFISSEEPNDFRKKLPGVLYGLPVSIGHFRLPSMNYQPQVGSRTYTAHGPEFSGDIVLSSRIPLTAENYVLAQVAAKVIEEKLLRALNSSGISVNVSTAFRKVPQERFNMLVSLGTIDEDGFVEGTVNRNLVHVLNRVRAVIEEVPSPEEIKRYLPIVKALLSSRHEQMKTYPGFYIATIRTRYLEGKDLFSKYQATLEAADPEKVAGIYKAISKGSVVEYIVDNTLE